MIMNDTVKCLIGSLKEDKLGESLICEGRELYNLEAEGENEFKPAVVW